MDDEGFSAFDKARQLLSILHSLEVGTALHHTTRELTHEYIS